MIVFSRQGGFFLSTNSFAIFHFAVAAMHFASFHYYFILFFVVHKDHTTHYTLFILYTEIIWYILICARKAKLMND